MSKPKRRVQASKRQRNIDEMGQAFVELRKGSRAQPHRNRARYDRNDFRRDSQNGNW